MRFGEDSGPPTTQPAQHAETLNPTTIPDHDHVIVEVPVDGGGGNPALSVAIVTALGLIGAAIVTVWARKHKAD